MNGQLLLRPLLRAARTAGVPRYALNNLHKAFTARDFLGNGQSSATHGPPDEYLLI
jgi:hypothetical protein